MNTKLGQRGTHICRLSNYSMNVLFVTINQTNAKICTRMFTLHNIEKKRNQHFVTGKQNLCDHGTQQIPDLHSSHFELELHMHLLKLYDQSVCVSVCVCLCFRAQIEIACKIHKDTIIRKGKLSQDSAWNPHVWKRG